MADCTRNLRRAHSQLKVLTSAKGSYMPRHLDKYKTSTLLIQIEFFLGGEICTDLFKNGPVWHVRENSPVWHVRKWPCVTCSEMTLCGMFENGL